MDVNVQRCRLGAEHICCAQCVQISDPWLLHEVLAVAGRRPDLIDKPRGFPLPVYDCFDRVSPHVAVGSGAQSADSAAHQFSVGKAIAFCLLLLPDRPAPLGESCGCPPRTVCVGCSLR